MLRPSRSVPFALFHAALLVAATLLAGSSARGACSPAAAPILLTLGILAADVVAQRRVGRLLPSAGALIVAATIVAVSLLLADEANRFAAFVPILGCAAAAPGLLGGEATRTACRSVR